MPSFKSAYPERDEGPIASIPSHISAGQPPPRWGAGTVGPDSPGTPAAPDRHRHHPALSLGFAQPLLLSEIEPPNPAHRARAQLRRHSLAAPPARAPDRSWAKLSQVSGQSFLRVSLIFGRSRGAWSRSHWLASSARDRPQLQPSRLRPRAENSSARNQSSERSAEDRYPKLRMLLDAKLVQLATREPVSDLHRRKTQGQHALMET